MKRVTPDALERFLNRHPDFSVEQAFTIYYGSLDDACEEIGIFNHLATIESDFARFLEHYTV